MIDIVIILTVDTYCVKILLITGAISLLHVIGVSHKYTYSLTSNIPANNAVFTFAQTGNTNP